MTEYQRNLRKFRNWAWRIYFFRRNEIKFSLVIDFFRLS